MARSWAELLGDEGTAADEAERSGFFSRLRDSLGKSRRALTAELALGGGEPAGDPARGARAGGRGARERGACPRPPSSFSGSRPAATVTLPPACRRRSPACWANPVGSTSTS